MAIANVLFTTDPTDSYRLHQQVAAALPDEPDVQYEWALEQHRAKQYASAVESFAKFISANPDYAPALGLRAECLLRTAKIREAVDSWQKSLAASQGTLEDFETIVCQVNGDVRPEKERCDLLALTRKCDITAAVKLIDLDCNFTTDWWNSRVNRLYLQHGLAIIRQTKFADAARCNEALCVADFALLNDPDKPPATPVLQKLLSDRGFLLDVHHTLPTNSRMLVTMLSSAIVNKAVTRAEATNWFGDAVETRAEQGKDLQLYMLASKLFYRSSHQAQVENEGWQATGDIYFARMILLTRDRDGQLQSSDPLLSECSKKISW